MSPQTTLALHSPSSGNALSPGQPYRWPGGPVSPSESRLGLYPSHRAALTAEVLCPFSVAQLGHGVDASPSYSCPPIATYHCSCSPPGSVWFGHHGHYRAPGCPGGILPANRVGGGRGYTGEFSILPGRGWETPPP